MKPIIIDAATIFDPARLLAVLAAVDIRYSEVWVSQRYDHFKEKDFITGSGTDSKFALLPDSKGHYKTEQLEIPSKNEKLDPTLWMTGPKILRWALDKGMVVPKDLFKYEELAIDLEKKNKIDTLSEAIMLGPPADYDLRTGEELTKQYLKEIGRSSLGPNYYWRLEPYGIGHGLGLILAAAQEENVDPFFSHPNFYDNISTHNYSFYDKSRDLSGIIQQNANRERKEIIIQKSINDMSLLVKSPENLSISEIAYYLDQKDRIDFISGIVTASKNIESRNKDIGIIAGKFIGTTAVDALLFSGSPVSSICMSAYEMISRFFKK